MGITLEQAKNLRLGDILYHTRLKNADKTPMRFRVNGEVKTWKRDKNRIRVPLKYGLYSYAYLVRGRIGYAKGINGFVLTLDEVEVDLASVLTVCDELNPKLAFNSFKSELLVKMLKMESGYDPLELIFNELVNRGLNTSSGEWIGFEEAKKQDSYKE